MVVSQCHCPNSPSTMRRSAGRAHHAGAGHLPDVRQRLRADAADGRRHVVLLPQGARSSALMEPMTRRFVVAIERYAEREGIDLVRFERFERKDDRTLAYLRNFAGTEEVLYIGKAQKKARQAVHQRPRVPQAPVGETGCRVRVAGQRHPELHRRGPHAAPGRRPDGGKGRRPAAQVAGARAALVRGPGRRGAVST